METTDDNLIASSKEFLANMKDAIREQNKFIEIFAIQSDPDEQNELKIGMNIYIICLDKRLKNFPACIFSFKRMVQHVITTAYEASQYFGIRIRPSGWYE